MTSLIIKNFFSSEELNIINSIVNDAVEKSIKISFDNQEKHNIRPNEQYVYENQGRKDIYRLQFPNKIINKLVNEINKMTGKDLMFYSVQYTEYVGDLKGSPSLGVHSDDSIIDYTLDYQLESNISWGIGINDSVYEIEDNDILLLNSVTTLHYRPVKKFKKDDYVKMLLFRFAEKDFPRYTTPKLNQDQLNKINHLFNNYYKDGDK
jgi:hypothetical protein